MKITKEQIDKLVKKTNRNLELATGRINYNRLHKDKTIYSRKNNLKIIQNNLVGN
jgi:hypothetical protein